MRLWRKQCFWDLASRIVYCMGENQKVFSSQDPFKYKCFVAFVFGRGKRWIIQTSSVSRRLRDPVFVSFKRGDLCNDDLSAYLQVGFCKIGPNRYTNIPDHTWMSERLRSLVAGWSAALLKQKPQSGAGSVRPAEMVGASAFWPPGPCRSSTPKHRHQSHVISTSVCP